MRALTAPRMLVMASVLGCSTPGPPPSLPACVAAPSAAAAPAPEAPATPVSPPSPLDLAWIVDAQRVLLHHSTGGLMSSESETFDLRRSEARFYGVATAGGRDTSGKYTARMWTVDVDAKEVDASLRDLAKAEPGRPDTRKIIVEGSDTYLAWSITIDDADVCDARTCRPRRSVRLTSAPDGHDFYYWYAWSGPEPIALDRARPDAAAAALLAVLRGPKKP